VTPPPLQLTHELAAAIMPNLHIQLRGWAPNFVVSVVKTRQAEVNRFEGKQKIFSKYVSM